MLGLGGSGDGLTLHGALYRNTPSDIVTTPFLSIMAFRSIYIYLDIDGHNPLKQLKNVSSRPERPDNFQVTALKNVTRKGINLNNV
ncbi:hypothetical protein Bhyg_16119 [Pseudolycoriella hygida]|uniref:Uncharacterized protein n=1 Tax=Pseudolycoriella hygida TaxID=35572 RepID=A0A9Q0MIZ9_9DIPT|nr:hypothetical protein Bhyg_16119 [Pseudolycoriella hygida]